MKKITIIYLILFVITGIFCIEINGSINKDNGTVIFIDPGHGGVDGGAIGSDGTYEKDITLSIALKLRDILIQNNYVVKMTRQEDTDLSTNPKNKKSSDIHSRVKMINESNANIYISIHANIYPSKNVFGAQVFYNASSTQSGILANNIQSSLILNLLNTYRVSKPISNVYLVDHVEKIGCLVEVGFLSNQKDLANLKNEIYQERLAYYIYLGIYEYLTKYSHNSI